MRINLIFVNVEPISEQSAKARNKRRRPRQLVVSERITSFARSQIGKLLCVYGRETLRPV